jgi:uncharacterized protein YdaU (DUF1376 family)
MNYYPHHIGDFIRDTANLNDHQTITYMRMLWAYYLSEKAFPDEPDDIAFAMRSDNVTVSLLLKHYFVKLDDGWHQKRIDNEIAIYKAKLQQASNAGKASAERRFNARSTPVGNKSTSVQPTKNQEPRTNISTPEGVSESVWQEFQKVRKALKAPITEIAIKGIYREAEKANLTLEEALTICVERSWRGFKAEWLDSKKTFVEQKTDKDREAYERMMGRS